MDSQIQHTTTVNANQKYVLRRKPPGKLLPSAHAVDREFRVLSELYDTDVPVAKPYILCEDEGIVGSMFYVMSYMRGEYFGILYLKPSQIKTIRDL